MIKEFNLEPLCPFTTLACCRLIELIPLSAVLITLVSLHMFSMFSEKKELVISLGLSTADVYLLIIGILFVMLGMVMDEAYRIHVENKQII